MAQAILAPCSWEECPCEPWRPRYLAQRMGDVVDVASQLVALDVGSQRVVYAVTVDFEGKDEVVSIDPEKGPILMRADGLIDYVQQYLGRIKSPSCWGLDGRQKKAWRTLTVTESEVLVHIAAKMNRRVAERLS
uniref:Uncharacterized protein n=1 Tax=Alexandrium catenella TaxID=2925 RepID=A0A7S1KYG8_ALECA